MSLGFSKGFTLIELLVVVLIIGILSAVALPQYTKAVEKARAAEAFTMLKSLSDAAVIYYMQNGSYTGFSNDTIDISMPESGGKYFQFNLGGGYVYAPNHMDITATHKKGFFTLSSVHYGGKRSRLYCKPWTDDGVSLCKALGAPADCAKNAECNLPMFATSN
ncbi:MAG: prepilin-type N-terminal cleavage/methylation domain-containing protein [Elusimicrobiaceae bacterium]|nr:prepilin-type N-terminal cleavage/methylation domain-containing protein [Elusimicrobiaceae bacterium]